MPLLVALAGPPARAAGPAPVRSSRWFALGLTTGGVYFAGTLYWIPDVMRTYGDLNAAVAILVGLMLVA